MEEKHGLYLKYLYIGAFSHYLTMIKRFNWRLSRFFSTYSTNVEYEK